MALTYRATFIMSARHMRAPIQQAPASEAGRITVADGARYRSIGSLQALALAATAALVTTALMRLVL